MRPLFFSVFRQLILPIMKRIQFVLPVLICLVWSATSQAVDLVNGEQINRSCAMCHGKYGQGAPGPFAPRMAGIDRDYLIKATREYRDDERTEITMAYATGLKLMTDQDIEDVSVYLEQLQIPPRALIDVKSDKGDADSGRRLFKECKGCHGADGMGKPKEKAPRLAGQHVGFLDLSIRMFKTRERHHGVEKDDQLLFDDLSQQNIDDLMAWIATLDDEDYLAATRGLPPEQLAQAHTDESPAAPETAQPTPVEAEQPQPAVAQAEPKQEPTKKHPVGLQISDITQTVAKLQIQPGITPEDAELAMLSKAAGLNLKLVGEQHLSRELQLRGQQVRYLKILQFCDPEDAMLMIMQNPIYASYMPCRIAIVEDEAGKYWIMMLNLDMLIESQLIPREVSEIAIRVNQSLLKIMVAGASGDF